MAAKTVVLVAASVTAGFVITMLVHRNDRVVEPVSQGFAAADDALVLAAESGSGKVPQAEASQGRAEDTREPGQQIFLPDAPTPHTQQELDARLKELQKGLAASQEKVRLQREGQENALLLAAGFAIGRIQWIRQRDAELQSRRQQEDLDRQKRGLPPDKDMQLAYIYDSDLDLRYEIGDEEYASYRRALGRREGIRVLEVAPGSNADSAGLRPDDAIVRYDGKRVFNIGELNKFSTAGSARAKREHRSTPGRPDRMGHGAERAAEFPFALAASDPSTAAARTPD